MVSWPAEGRFQARLPEEQRWHELPEWIQREGVVDPAGRAEGIEGVLTEDGNGERLMDL